MAARRSDWKPSTASRLCSDHFRECDINRDRSRTRLKAYTVPMRFKAFPGYLKQVTNYFFNYKILDGYLLYNLDEYVSFFMYF